MSEFIVREERFKLGIAERVPMPNDGECFLLYQTGAGEQDSMLINCGVKYSSARVRRGRYNQKVTFSLENRELSQDYRIVMVDSDFYFNVSLKISYSLQDVKKYFFGGRMEEEDILHTVRDIIRTHDARWDVRQGWEIQNALETAIEQSLKRYEGVKFRVKELTVTPDEKASRMLQSNRDKVVEIHVAENETDQQLAFNEQSKRLAESERELKLKQMEEMAFMMKHFGNLGPIVNEYLKQNVNGMQLYEYIMKGKTDEMSMLNTALSNDIISQEEAFEKLTEILKNNGFMQTEGLLPENENVRIEEKKTEKEEEKEEEEETDKTKTVLPVKDGGYL